MRIDRINIDGFGVFHDKNVKGFQKGINVLYGPNEAGKSTLLDFIRFTLFEYPRFKDERRPPLAGGKHGGRLFLKDSIDQSFSIYRSGNGKDVSFEQNGQETDNLNTYRQLIGNASIDLYKNVYAITLDELLHVDQLSDSGMEDRIFSMGMGLAGVDFGKFEKGLANHAEDYFKSRGSTQVLVNIVDEIREKETKILELRNKLGEYDRLSAQKEELEASLSKIKEQREELSAAKNEYADFSRAYESFVSYTTAEEELKNLGTIERYPIKLEEDFETCNHRLKASKEEHSKLEKSIEQLNDEVAGIEWNEELANHLDLLDFFKTNVKVYEEAKSTIDLTKEKLNSAERSSEQILQKLGNNLEKEQLLSIEGTFELRTKASETADEKQSLLRQIENKSDRLDQAKKEVVRIKDKIDQLTLDLNKLEISNDNDREQAATKRIKLDTAFQKALQGTSGVKNSNTPLILALVFIAIGGVLFAINSLAAGIVLGIAVLSLIYVLITRKKEDGPEETDDPNTINKALETIKSNIEQYDQLKKDHVQFSAELSQAKKEEKNLNAEIQVLKTTVEQLDEQWIALLNVKGLPVTISEQRMGDFLSNIEELKRFHQDAIEAKRMIENSKARIQQFEEKLKDVINESAPFESSMIYALIKKLEIQEKAQQQKAQIENQLKAQQRELHATSTNINQLEKEKQEFLKQVKAETDEAFYTGVERQKQFEELNTKKDNAAATIKTICGAERLDTTLKALEQFTPSELNTKLEHTEREYEAVTQEYDELNRELATINTEIRHILEPDEMFSLQNEKESLQERLKSETKEWLATKVALKALNESKQRYEQERQPEVITQTRKYFKAITENAYEDLRISLSDKHVSIIDDRGRHKTVEELSRGTREQLLLALRLGLIEEYEKNAEPLPVVLDDILVNFDVHRAKNLAKVLTNFAKDRQVILFTCHEHTQELFRKNGATILDWN